ncbi:MAG: hypothetical protein WCZ17_08825, partial [Candidatus Kapaibacterium sp.]
MYSQEAIRIIDSDLSNYPDIVNNIFVFDSNGNPVYNMNAGNFSIRDNGVTQSQIDSYTCTAQEPKLNISYTLVFDLG